MENELPSNQDPTFIEEAIRLLEGYKETCGDEGDPEADEIKNQIDTCIDGLKLGKG